MMTKKKKKTPTELEAELKRSRSQVTHERKKLEKYKEGLKDGIELAQRARRNE